MSKTPTGLPEADPTETQTEDPAIQSAKVRVCNVCGKGNARISSNYSGVAAHCTCGNSWPLASSSLAPSFPVAPDRGLSKQTLVEPNWDLAFEDLEGENNEQVGPKRKG